MEPVAYLTQRNAIGKLTEIMLTRWLHLLKPLACMSVPCFLSKDLIQSFGNFWMTLAKCVILAMKEGSFVCNH